MKQITKQTIKLNFKVICKFKYIVILNTLIWLCINLFPLLLSLIIREILNAIEINNSKLHFSLSFLFISLAILSSLNILYGGKIDTICRFKMSQLMRKNFLVAYIKNRKVNFKSLGEGVDVMTEDLATIEELISVEIDLFCKIVFAISAFLILIDINLKLTLFALLPLIVVSSIISKIGDIVKSKHYNSRQSNIEYNSFFSEIIINRETIQLLDAEEAVINRIKDLGNKRAKQSVTQSIFFNFINEIAFLSYSISVTLILVLSIPFISNNQMTIGDFSLFLNLVGYIGAYNNLFTEVFCTFKYMENLIERVSKVLKFNTKETATILYNLKLNLKSYKNIVINKPSCLVFEDFQICFNKNIIKQFEIKKNEFFVICGKTGSGKSRFLDAILGYCNYDGKVFIDGVNRNDIEIEKEISLVPQEPGFIKANLAENIGLVNYEFNAERYLKLVNLNNELNNENNDIGVNARKLSDGQRQRLALARGIAHASNILIIDDATSFLDSKNEIDIIRKIKKLQFTIIMVSNRRNVLDQADRILVMEQGATNAIGVKDELLNSSDIFKEIYNL